MDWYDWFWLILILGVICLSVWGVAHADVYEIIKFQFKSSPTICIFEPDPTLVPDFYADGGIYDVSREAILEWETSLTERSNFTWNFTTLEYPFEYHDKMESRDFPQCNALMVYEVVLEGTTLGYTSYDYSNSSHNFAWVVTSLKAAENNTIFINVGDIEEGDEIIVTLSDEVEWLPMNDVKNIVIHELGHGLFGLGHYIVDTYDCEDCDKDLYKRSVMFSNFKPFSDVELQITDIDVEMVFMLVSDNGYHKNYGYIPDSCLVVDDKLRCDING